MRFDNEGDNRADSRAAGNAEDVRIGQRIAKKRLKAGSRD